jgi:hypothetical protein
MSRPIVIERSLMFQFSALLQRLGMLVVLAVIPACIPAQHSYRFQVVAPNNFKGLCVVVERDDHQNHHEPISVEIAESGIGYLPISASRLRLDGVRLADGRQLTDLELLRQDTEVGYKCISSRSDGTYWFFIGTREQYNKLQQQKTHQIGQHVLHF